MPTANDLPEVLETTEPERLATGFIFTEGPLWHPDSYWYFVDLRRNQLLRLMPGKEPELVRTTIGGNGTTFDLLGRLIVCEGDDRRLTRMGLDGKVESLVDNETLLCGACLVNVAKSSVTFVRPGTSDP